MYGLETMVMTETKLQEKGHVCKKNNWVRRTAGMNNVDQRIMEELGGGGLVQKSFRRKQVRNRFRLDTMNKWKGNGSEKSVRAQSGWQKEEKEDRNRDGRVVWREILRNWEGS